MIARPELPENAETLFRAVAAVADALYVVDAAGRITFLNPAALKILGYADEDELLGRISTRRSTTCARTAHRSRQPSARCCAPV